MRVKLTVLYATHKHHSGIVIKHLKVTEGKTLYVPLHRKSIQTEQMSMCSLVFQKELGCCGSLVL